MTALALPRWLSEGVGERDLWHCVRCGRSAFPGNRQVHHRDARGMGGSLFAHRWENLLNLCGTSSVGDNCHAWVESHREEAREQGYLIPPGGDPLEVPVLCRDRQWHYLVDDQWSPILTF